MSMYEVQAFAKKSQDLPFERITVSRNVPGDDDVQFDVIYCGICHSDVHFSDGTIVLKFPLVPGHELAGRVTHVGRNVDGVRIGDTVGVGCVVDSCWVCRGCREGLENYCEKGMTMTYGHDTVHGHLQTESGYTHGGYSTSMTVNQRYLIRIPESYPLEKAGPVLCAGITMYAPLSHHGAIEGGLTVGVVGMGGLGQMGVRLAKAMGNTVVAFSTSAAKRDAVLAMGADEFIVTSDPESLATTKGRLNLILNTVSVHHEIAPYLAALDRDGTLVQLGLITAPLALPQMSLFKRQRVTGSVVGSVSETQQCIEFCARHNIQPATELITAGQLDDVYKKLKAGLDKPVRYVLDIKASF